MKRHFKYIIPEEYNHTTISAFLKAKGYPHAVMVHLKKTPEGILLNGTWEYFNTLLKTGDILEIQLIELDSSEKIPPVYAPFSILYEDEDILVIDKPANMPIHPSLNHYENTLANAVCHYFASQNIPYTFRCVNRLDKNTTGLTIVAKHMLSSAILSQDVAVKNIEREYLAIVSGETDDSGTIDAPIGRKGASTIERQIDYENGERAVTHYRKIDTKNGYTLLSLKLDTGRTHQIRVHMSSIGHPLIGDFLYHPTSMELPRQALHSHRLRFIHPITKETMEFTAPLPQDMADFWKHLSL
ncbi:MAG: RluA family pseudouridine synthase [Lachnospiraceae bacterium]|nr:RluA family pseudouridine synthase [Lachnospiraceae bacterium]